jgi:hypothetical protein
MRRPLLTACSSALIVLLIAAGANARAPANPPTPVSPAAKQDREQGCLSGSSGGGAGAGASTAGAASTVPSASAETGNPIIDQGSSYHYRSTITAITPATAGLSVHVLEFADRLLLRNRTGRAVTVYGYCGEPYARILGDGTVEENLRSPAVYLNTNFYANAVVPASASATAAPKWSVIDRTGQFEWHDHRIHWMSPVTPPQVKDKSKLTKIFNWEVPIAVGDRTGSVDGQLFWTPATSSTPVAAIVSFVVVVLASVALVIVVRRRRRRVGDDSGSRPAASGEAW